MQSEKIRTTSADRCFICGGEVAPSEDVRAMVKAFEQGMPVVPSSRRFFICLSCGAYVMANADDPERPCGTIADTETRYLRRRVRQEAMKLCRSGRDLKMLGETLKEALGLEPEDGLVLKEMDERMLRRTLSILTSAWWRRRKASLKERPRRRNYGRRR